jgi:hypothetical protein
MISQIMQVYTVYYNLLLLPVINITAQFAIIFADVIRDRAGGKVSDFDYYFFIY